MKPVRRVVISPRPLVKSPSAFSKLGYAVGAKYPVDVQQPMYKYKLLVAPVQTPKKMPRSRRCRRRGGPGDTHENLRIKSATTPWYESDV